MQDQYIQKYNKAIEKHDILHLSNHNERYAKRDYLSLIKSVEVRRMFTALRIDYNKLGAYRHNSANTDCVNCLVYENAEHFLLNCKERKL